MWDQVPRRSKHPYKHQPLDIPEVGSDAKEELASLQTQTYGYTRGGIRCLGGVSIPTNTDHMTNQRWDQVSGRSKHPYKHGPHDKPEVRSGV